MSQIIQILNFEEGYREKPYRDTEGYPTVACGVKIGPKGADLSNYTFTVPRTVGDAWLQVFTDALISSCKNNPTIYAAMKQCNPARADVLYSMAYQMGVAGLAGFKNTLSMIAAGNFSGASTGMLNSQWARQTPKRAQRHAEVMRSGSYDIYKGKI
ncbi:lysozyme [Izhakiella australiensis]|uniref:Lysozyme n=1 Tax=Izhakiella australiensis TaxID=1926881 RepID=A0A1S8Y920_9GAMM|nr:glycoside hydrolase family protein [Izhakiella australiensis]OON35619.1 lysozyme [Izhakiella australiensis]